MPNKSIFPSTARRRQSTNVSWQWSRRCIILIPGAREQNHAVGNLELNGCSCGQETSHNNVTRVAFVGCALCSATVRRIHVTHKPWFTKTPTFVTTCLHISFGRRSDNNFCFNLRAFATRVQRGVRLTRAAIRKTYESRAPSSEEVHDYSIWNPNVNLQHYSSCPYRRPWDGSSGSAWMPSQKTTLARRVQRRKCGGS